MSSLTFVPPRRSSAEILEGKSHPQWFGLLSTGEEVQGAQGVHGASRNPQGEAAAGMHHHSQCCVEPYFTQ